MQKKTKVGNCQYFPMFSLYIIMIIINAFACYGVVCIKVLCNKVKNTI
jgi:hypothetical protein